MLLGKIAVPLREFLQETLPHLCDADPLPLAEYIIAILARDQTPEQTRQSCIEKLEEFLPDTEKFVDKLLGYVNDPSTLPKSAAEKQKSESKSKSRSPSEKAKKKDSKKQRKDSNSEGSSSEERRESRRKKPDKEKRKEKREKKDREDRGRDRESQKHKHRDRDRSRDRDRDRDRTRRSRSRSNHRKHSQTDQSRDRKDKDQEREHRDRHKHRERARDEDDQKGKKEKVEADEVGDKVDKERTSDENGKDAGLHNNKEVSGEELPIKADGPSLREHRTREDPPREDWKREGRGFGDERSRGGRGGDSKHRGICRDFAYRGVCQRGERCWYDHVVAGVSVDPAQFAAQRMGLLNMFPGALPGGMQGGLPGGLPGSLLPILPGLPGSLPGLRRGLPDGAPYPQVPPPVGFVPRPVYPGRGDGLGSGRMIDESDGSGQDREPRERQERQFGFGQRQPLLPPSARFPGEIRGAAIAPPASYAAGSQPEHYSQRHQRGSQGGQQSPSTKLFVKNIPEELNTFLTLSQHFQKFGEIVNIKIQATKKYALVSFNTHEQAQAALSSSDAVCGNRFIQVSWSTNPGGSSLGSAKSSITTTTNQSNNNTAASAKPSIDLTKLTADAGHATKLATNAEQVLKAKKDLLMAQVKQQKVMLTRLDKQTSEGTLAKEEKQSLMSKLVELNTQIESGQKEQKELQKQLAVLQGARDRLTTQLQQAEDDQKLQEQQQQQQLAQREEQGLHQNQEQAQNAREPPGQLQDSTHGVRSVHRPSDRASPSQGVPGQALLHFHPQHLHGRPPQAGGVAPAPMYIRPLSAARPPLHRPQQQHHLQQLQQQHQQLQHQLLQRHAHKFDPPGSAIGGASGPTALHSNVLRLGPAGLGHRRPFMSTNHPSSVPPFRPGTSFNTEEERRRKREALDRELDLIASEKGAFKQSATSHTVNQADEHREDLALGDGEGDVDDSNIIDMNYAEPESTGVELDSSKQPPTEPTSLPSTTTVQSGRSRTILLSKQQNSSRTSASSSSDINSTNSSNSHNANSGSNGDSSAAAEVEVDVEPQNEDGVEYVEHSMHTYDDDHQPRGGDSEEEDDKEKSWRR